jgi:hypothetical protein
MEDRATQDPGGSIPSRRVPVARYQGPEDMLPPGDQSSKWTLSSWWRRRLDIKLLQGPTAWRGRGTLRLTVHRGRWCLDIKLLRGPTAWRGHGTVEPTVHRGRWYPGPADALTPRSPRDQSGRSTLDDRISSHRRRLGRSSVSGPCGPRGIGAAMTLKSGTSRVPSRRGTKVADDMKVPSCRRRLACRGASSWPVPRSLDARAPWFQGGRGTSATKAAAIPGDLCTTEGIGSMLPAPAWDRGPGRTSVPISLDGLDRRCPERPWSPGIMGQDPSRDHGTEATRRPWNLATHPAMYRGCKGHLDPMRQGPEFHRDHGDKLMEAPG